MVGKKVHLSKYRLNIFSILYTTWCLFIKKFKVKKLNTNSKCITKHTQKHEPTKKHASTLSVLLLYKLHATKLTHWDINKIATILQMTFSNEFSLQKVVFWIKFHWILFLGVQLIISQHWFRQCLCAKEKTGHYLKQCWLSFIMSYGITMPQWINDIIKT